MVDAAPAVVDGLVYVGSHDGRAYCLNAATGAQVWSYTTIACVGSSAVADGRVYVGSGDADDRLYCLDASTARASGTIQQASGWTLLLPWSRAEQFT
jgi:outer membrane protein assembly factor BamB